MHSCARTRIILPRARLKKCIAGLLAVARTKKHQERAAPRDTSPLLQGLLLARHLRRDLGDWSLTHVALELALLPPRRPVRLCPPTQPLGAHARRLVRVFLLVPLVAVHLHPPLVLGDLLR